MKNFAKFLGSAILGLAFATTAIAQTGANTTGTATATIVTPIAISSTAVMSFGNIAVNATPGTVVLTTAPARTPSGGVTLPGTTGTVTAAAFHVTGIPSATYTIAVTPASVDITSGVNTMAVDTWTTNPAATGTLSGAGAQDIAVGATLHVAGSQPAGVYSTAAGDEFTVTVNYN